MPTNEAYLCVVWVNVPPPTSHDLLTSPCPTSHYLQKKSLHIRAPPPRSKYHAAKPNLFSP